MLRYLTKSVRFLLHKAKNIKESAEKDEGSADCLSGKLYADIEEIKGILGPSDDIVVREFDLGTEPHLHAALIFIDGLTSNTVISESIIKPLMQQSQSVQAEDFSIESLRRSVIYAGGVRERKKVEELIEGCLMGEGILLVEGRKSGLLICCKQWAQRSVSEPQTESVVRGPREGFTENFRTNTSMIRRKIKSPSLRLENFCLGERTATHVCLVYLADVADPKLVDEARKRLGNINTDAILESGYIEQYIEDSPFSLFSTIGYSEKPDVVAAKVLEGRVAIIVEGTPFVLTAPMLFVESLQSSEDYYTRPVFASFIRILRYMAFFISAFAPAIYVALTTFHQELLPTSLLFTMAQAREGIPFPALFEAIIMLVVFEVLKEAGLRLPRPIGQAVSIVGALVMGEAAVSAGLVGTPMVITMAIAAVSGFVIPNHSEAISILRLMFLILSGIMGGVGILIGYLALLVHMGALMSFGVPFTSPFAPMDVTALKDSVIRAPLWRMTTRPKAFNPQDEKRRGAYEPVGSGQSDSSGFMGGQNGHV